MSYLLIILITSLTWGSRDVYSIDTMRFTSAAQCELAAKKIKDVINLGKDVKTTCIALENN